MYIVTASTLFVVLLAIYVSVLLVNFIFVREFEWLNAGLYSLSLIGAYFIAKVFDHTIELNAENLRQSQEAEDMIKTLLENLEQRFKDEGDKND